ncbi:MULTISPECIES: hypothetical protein [Bacillaceae]|nr:MULTISPECIES: hypothetical protein [Bacillaceae]
MDLYKEAYEHYTQMCENYGMDCIPFYHFMHNLTDDQIQQYIQTTK